MWRSFAPVSALRSSNLELPAAVPQWHDQAMGTYHQYCPVARASEILAERWNPLIVRNLMFGANTFSAIARGVPTMSRSMLLKRLEELESAGVIEASPKPDGRG